MRLHPTLLLAALLLGSAAAAQTIDANNLNEEVLSLARGIGSAKLDITKEGNPMITGHINETRYNVFFFGCVQRVKCQSIQFYAGWETSTPVSLSRINEWNRNKRYARAYIDLSDDPVVEMDVHLEHGVSRRNLEAQFELWKSLVNQFSHHIRP